MATKTIPIDAERDSERVRSAPYAVITYHDGVKRNLFYTRDIGAETMGERRICHLAAIAHLMADAAGPMEAGDVNAWGDMLDIIANDVDGDMMHLIAEEELPRGWLDELAE